MQVQTIPETVSKNNQTFLFALGTRCLNHWLTMNCHACNKTLSPHDNSKLVCSVCTSQWHGVCARPQPTDTKNNTLQNWTCENCTRSKNEAPNDLETARFNAIMSQFANTNASIMSCSQRIDKLNELVATQSQLIQSCANDICDLRKENANLKQRIDALENKDTNPSDDNLYDIQNEISQRINREKNILIMGLTESNSQEDLTKTKTIIDSIIQGHSPNINVCFRVGKPKESQGKPRPLKVCFNNSENAVAVLKNKSKLANTAYSSLYFTSDSTFTQRRYLENLRKELQQRKENGEEQLTIKYVNKVPKIVPIKKRGRQEQESPNQNQRKYPKNLSQMDTNPQT